jgi:hypothetical protein
MGRIITTPLLEDKLVAFWNLDNASNSDPVVSSYGSYSLNLFEGFTSIAGKINQGVEFYGEHQGLWTNEQLWNLLTNPTSFSVSFWHKIPDNTQNPFTVMGNSFGSMGFHFDYFSSGHGYDGSSDLNWVPGSYGISFRMSGPDGPYKWNAIYANEATPNNTWTLVTATYDLPTTTMKLYLNGVLKASYGNAVIGENSEPGWHGFALNGTVVAGGKVYGVNQCFDALGFWSRALNQNEISILYNGGNGRQYKFIDNKNKVSIKKQNLGGGKLYTNKSPIIEDILQTQTSTIGQLHYNILRRDGEENKPIRTVFGNSSGGPNGSTSDKVVRNEIQQSWNRINYNMNAINMSTQLSNFTVIFDARVNGTADGYGFYWYAKGTYNVNTPQNYAVCTNYPCEEGACLDSRCEDYNECYEFDQDGYCINYDECYSFACLDFDCWTYDYTNCQGTVLYSNWDSFPDRGSNYGNRPDNDSYVVFFDYYNNRIRAWWGASDPRSSIFGSNLGEAVSISAVLQNPGNLRDGKWRKHKIQYSGNVIKVFIDDKLHLTVTDTTPWDRNKTGRNFGLYGGVGGASAFNEFRNFKFYDYIR